MTTPNPSSPEEIAKEIVGYNCECDYALEQSAQQNIKFKPCRVCRVATAIAQERERLNKNVEGLAEIFIAKVNEIDSIRKDLETRLTEVEAERDRLQKEVVEAVIESRNNYCPCCHARLEEICGPCKWCKDSKNHLDTERSMYQAWRKRAEEAEKSLASSTERVRQLEEVLALFPSPDHFNKPMSENCCECLEPWPCKYEIASDALNPQSTNPSREES